MKLLAIDLSTSCTGWATFEDNALTGYGIIEPEVKGGHKLRYPKKALYTVMDMAEKVAAKVLEVNPDEIVIEEVNRGVSRISQKSLDAVHFFLLRELMAHPRFLDVVTYRDSNGKTGWRGKLGIALSDDDKILNKEIRKEAKKMKIKHPDVINWKTVAVRYVNKHFNLGLCTDFDPKTDGDIADAICLGVAHLTK